MRGATVKREAKGNVTDHECTFEVREPSVPLSRAEELREYYRLIAEDKRSTVALRAAAK